MNYAALAHQATDPNTPPDQLARWALLEDDEVRAAVAGNPNTPETVLFDLAVDFPERFLANPLLPLLLLEQPDLVLHLKTEAQLALLRCADIPMLMLTQLRDEQPIRAGQYQAPLPRERALMHVQLAGEAEGPWTSTVNDLLERHLSYHTYRSQARRYNAWENPFVLPGVAPAWFLEFLLHTHQLSGVVAQSPDLTEAQFTHLLHMRSGRDVVAATLARHPKMPEHLLGQLSATDAVDVRVAVAKHAHTSPAILGVLSSDNSPQVRRAVAANPHTPPAVLAQLARDEHAQVRKAVAMQHHAPADMLARLAHDENSEVRGAVAANLHAPLATLEDCAYDKIPAVRRSAARNMRMPTEVLARRAARNDEIAVWALEHRTRKAQVQASNYADALARRDFDLLRDIAAASTTPVEMLTTLSQHDDPRIRSAVAGNRQANQEILARLARDPQHAVRRKVAAHDRAWGGLLADLAQDGHANVRRAVACNPHTPFVVLEDLAGRAHVEELDVIAHHPSMTAERRQIIYGRYFMRQIFNGEASPMARGLALAGVALPEHMLWQAARSYYWGDRLLVARNPHASPAVYASLTRDGDRYVRATARASLAALSQKEPS